MIDPRSEALFPLGKGPPDYLPGAGLATWWRWALRGVRDVRLETLMVGGRRYSSVQAYERFLAQLNGPRCGTPDAPSPKRRSEQVSAAVRAAELF